MRIQGGNFNTGRGFLRLQPGRNRTTERICLRGLVHRWPVPEPGRYRRDNVNGNFTRRFGERHRTRLPLLLGRNDFYSSARSRSDLVVPASSTASATWIRPTAAASAWARCRALLQRTIPRGELLKADGFVCPFAVRPVLELHVLPERSGTRRRLPAARFASPAKAPTRSTRARTDFGRRALLTAGGNFHDNQINVGLYPREGRVPTGVSTRANAHVTNGAGYAQESVSY